MPDKERNKLSVALPVLGETLCGEVPKIFFAFKWDFRLTQKIAQVLSRSNKAAGLEEFRLDQSWYVSCILHILHTTYIYFRPPFYVTRLRIENYTSGDDVKPGKYFINSFQKLVSRHK